MSLTSPSLLTALKQTPGKPAERLQALFDLLEKYPLEASEHDHGASNDQQLLQYLTGQAKQAGAKLPEMLASQLYFMALEAIRQQPYTPHALSHAKCAATALIQAQSAEHWSKWVKWPVNQPAYAIAASLFLGLGTAGILFSSAHISTYSPNASKHQQAAEHVLQLAAIPAAIPTPAIFNPQHAADMLASREKMREGRCQLPEAIVFSETERGIYLQNVVHGEISSNREIQEVSKRLREFIRCDYTPMLMKNSVS